jgi:hypothetical protein
MGASPQRSTAATTTMSHCTLLFPARLHISPTLEGIKSEMRHTSTYINVVLNGHAWALDAL